MKRSTLALATTAGLLASFAVIPATASASGQATSVSSNAAPKPLPPSTKAMYTAHSYVDPGLVVPAALPKLKTWTKNITDGASTFAVTQVGKNPFVVQATPSTTVTMPIIPVIVHMGAHTYNPTVTDPACAATSTFSASTLTLNSPVLKNHTYAIGALGSSQYVDFYQRANYYPQVQTLNPAYHVKLKPVVLAAINYTPASFTEYATLCRLGTFDINAWDNYVRNTVFPTVLTPLGYGPTTVPTFLFYNVVQYNGAPGNCCILGYHNAFSNPGFGGATQTYEIADYDASSAFTGSGDISVLSHEVGEWMDDPYVNNPTKPWGNIGQVTGCQSNLENGDPLSGTTISVTMPNGVTYHPQELAFTSWFYHQTPSTGVNGWYSSNGTFTTAAAPCP